MDEKNTVRAVAIDYKAVLRGPEGAHEGVAELLRWLDDRDVAWVLLTNNPMDATSALAAVGLPEPDLHLCRDDIPDKAKRGNKAWLEAAADRLGIRMNQLILIGTSQFDWYTGIHAGVVHIHARWASRLGAKITSLMSDEPTDVIELLEYFLLHEPRWAFRLDDEDRAFAIRSMLPFNARFPRGGGRTFTIKDIFTYESTVKVGDQDARDVLMLHLLCAAYLDGALPGQSFFCVYPSSTPAKGNPQLAGFLQRAKVMTGSSYKEDLLERVAQAPDTSLERYKRSIGQSTGRDISIAAQARTIRVNPAYKKKIAGKTVIVFDDFTTEGKSLEWARTLLSEAGAARVIALTIGKYPSRHTVYRLRPGVTIDPFTTNDVSLAHFQTTTGPGGAEEGPSVVLTTAMKHFAAAGEVAVEPQAPEAAPARMVHPAPRPVPAGTRSPMTAYKIARQRHLADMLTHLQQHAYPLVWRGEYLVPPGETTTTALWWIALPGQVEQWYDTREAERLVSGICLAVGIIWQPVAAPGGTTQLAEALARMEERRQG
ncbi:MULTISPECIES: hypothetical protein [Streptomyces]|uniref:Phosphoribosyltransferase domain-containing protein n=1 Tax=Streptomyces clavifer TaxID=68188 RepID=A0ABS4VHS5_9ACTN|nr:MULTISPECIES: hypothetical protein [Streptomyces]MBP2363422.1 hypothetical protein [Streptomyces clavifer]MDX2748039.1 hypothetical protein [Streptomyces sp. NRRL_B-2557]GHB29998.1 hypothetical protein GCM10010392_67810 [Streptomyces clavifer]